MLERKANRRIAIAGLGSIGFTVAQAIHEGIAGFTLTAASARDKAAARHRLTGIGCHVPVLDIQELEAVADLVVECCPAELLSAVTMPFLRNGKDVIVLSAGALIEHYELIDVAEASRAQIILPTGALIGLDAVTAAAEGKILSVRMITRKPIRGFSGAPYLVANGINIEKIDRPVQIFSGSPREATAGFPANVNAAVVLSLAGIGADETRLEIWADPTVDRNTHEIEVVSDSATFTMKISNVPSDNPKTSRIAALSVLACLRKLRAPIRVGT